MNGRKAILAQTEEEIYDREKLFVGQMKTVYCKLIFHALKGFTYGNTEYSTRLRNAKYRYLCFLDIVFA